MTLTRNYALGWRNRAVSGVGISGGSSVAGMPLANLLSTDRGLVWRSQDLTAPNTRFDVDFGVPRPIAAVSLQGHLMSQAATWTITLGTTLGGSDIYAGASQAAWFLPFSGPEEWEDGAWWGVAQDAYTGHPYLALQLLGSAYAARYLRVAISDAANPYGYMQAARLWAGEVWQPAYGATFGASHGWTDGSAGQVSRAGGWYVDEQRRRRVVRFALESVTAPERAWVHEIDRYAGTAREVLYLPDPTDYQECQRYGFLGRLAELSPMSRRYPAADGKDYQIEEWL